MIKLPLREIADHPPLAVHICFGLISSILFICCYYSTLEWMYIRFKGADSYYSHGFLVPFVSIYFLWQERSAFRATAFGTSYLGLTLMIASALLHLLGTVLYIFSLSGFSIWLFLFGISFFIFGLPISRQILFPLLFLGFMFPTPEAFISVLSLPLKTLVAKTGTSIISTLGIPIHREGFSLTIPAGTLLVGNPCSGLRSMIAFMALGSAYAYILHASILRKLLLFASSIPIAVISNVFRVPILVLISHFLGLEAAAPDTAWHIGSGLFVFALGLGLMYLLAWLLACKD